MRGLKHFDCTAQLPISRSHLLQMRGLKRLFESGISVDIMSHLLQMRGLKHNQKGTLETSKVASFTDAWIETFSFGSGTSSA